MTRILLAVGLVMLLYGTVLVFLAFDRDSHSASDTVRPFLILNGLHFAGDYLELAREIEAIAARPGSLDQATDPI